MPRHPKVDLSFAASIGSKTLKWIEPHVQRAEIAGAIRRGVLRVRIVEIVCVEDESAPLQLLFDADRPEGYVSRSRTRRFLIDNFPVEIYIAPVYDFGRMLALKTGDSSFVRHVIAKKYKQMGWVSTRDGLRRFEQCEINDKRYELKSRHKEMPQLPPAFKTEYDFFDFLKLSWVPPEKRQP